ncbi:MAG TPA: hypothetical protein DCS67_03970 [Clostridiales bacterium UBA8960]|nr:hypothetical protein [Clostridiales bacterium UBA8960]
MIKHKNKHPVILDADFYYNMLSKDDQEHAQRVTNLSLKIALALGLGGELYYLKRAAKYHDLGKLKITSDILNKSGPLTEAERKEMMIHAKYSGEMLCEVKEDLRVIEIAMLHHENYDGSGYPFRLKGNEIALESRIIRVADVYDALRSERSYKKEFPVDVCKKIMIKEKNHFDPVILKALLNIE